MQKYKIWTKDIEPEALAQIENIAKLPFIHHHIAVMPDVHAGKGSTIGTVIATKGAICPCAIGVDIGCGMTAIKLPFKIDKIIDHLQNIRFAIEKVVPVGFNRHQKYDITRTNIIHEILGDNLTCFENDNEQLLKIAESQLGTLGGGNHFIEVCQDTEGGAWVMLHSGSRNIGKRIADVHINNAKGLMKKYFIDLPDPDLAYLAQNTIEFDNYIHDMNWAQNYAHENRRIMMLNILSAIDKIIGNHDYTNCLHISCHHNYAQLENHFGKNVYITRKGAVSAKAGELGIIPGSMGTKSFIVRGLGNPQSFHSCSHGAGRKMSRIKARSTFTIQDLERETLGIECRKDEAIIDEIPSAYKNIDEVMNNQSDLVEIIYTLKQLICVKG